MLDNLAKAGRYLGQSLRLMVGLPEYDTYLSHMEREHPAMIPMTYDEFFRERQVARYEGQGRGCC